MNTSNIKYVNVSIDQKINVNHMLCRKIALFAYTCVFIFVKDFPKESAATLDIDIIHTHEREREGMMNYLKELGDESRKNRLLLLDLLLLFLSSSETLSSSSSLLSSSSLIHRNNILRCYYLTTAYNMTNI